MRDGKTITISSRRLSPETIAAISSACQQSLGDIKFLEVLINGLQANYASILKDRP